MVLYGMVRYGMVRYGMVWYGMVYTYGIYGMVRYGRLPAAVSLVPGYGQAVGTSICN